MDGERKRDREREKEKKGKEGTAITRVTRVTDNWYRGSANSRRREIIERGNRFERQWDRVSPVYSLIGSIQTVVPSYVPWFYGQHGGNHVRRSRTRLTVNENTTRNIGTILPGFPTTRSLFPFPPSFPIFDQPLSSIPLKIASFETESDLRAAHVIQSRIRLREWKYVVVVDRKPCLPLVLSLDNLFPIQPFSRFWIIWIPEAARRILFLVRPVELQDSRRISIRTILIRRTSLLPFHSPFIPRSRKSVKRGEGGITRDDAVHVRELSYFRWRAQRKLWGRNTAVLGRDASFAVREQPISFRAASRNRVKMRCNAD